MAITNKDITRRDVKALWKRVDRSLSLVTPDSEISGEPNKSLMALNMTPLELPDHRNLLGSLNANQLAEMQDSWLSDQIDRIKRYKKLKEAQEHPEIKELDINPLIINEKEVLALDARAFTE